MSTIDQRIVQLQFDNAQFERGVHTSINTLNALKSALDFSGVTSSISKVSSTMFKPMNLALTSVSSGFNAVEKIATGSLLSIGASITRVGAQVANGLLKPITSFNTALNQVVQGGWTRASNLEQAKFMIEGLGKTWEEVKPDIDYAVDQTRYGLDAAAKAAGQLLASNIQLGDDMKAALRGISGVATMTNSEYEEIAHVFTAVAGRNRVYATDLNRIAIRGLNATSKLAEYLETTEEAVKDMVSEGEIDFKTFAYAMDKAFGEQAKKANETFTGALANMKTALSRIGEKFATPYQQTFKGIYNSQRLLINQINTGLTPIYKTYEGFMTKFGTKITGFLDGLTKSLEDGSSPFHSFVNQVNTLFEALTRLNNVADIVSKVLDPISKKKIQAERSPLELYAEQLTELHNNIKDFMSTSNEQRKNGSFFSAEALIGRKQTYRNLKSQSDGLESYSDTIKDFFRSTKKELSGNLDFDEVKKFPLALGGIKEAIADLNKPTLLDKAGNAIKNTTDKVKKGVESFKISTEEAKKRVSGLYDVVEVANQVIRGDFENGVEIRFPLLEEAGYYPELIQNVVNELMDCSYRYDLYSDKLAASNEKMAESLGNPLKKFSDLDLTLAGLWSAFDTVKKVINAIVDGASEPLTNIATGLSKVFLKLTGSLGVGVIKFGAFLEKVEAFKKIKNTVNGALTAVYNFGSTLTGAVGKKIQQAEKLYNKIAASFRVFFRVFEHTEGFKQFAADVDRVKTAIVGFKDSVVGWITEKFSLFDNFDLSIPDLTPLDLSTIEKLAEFASNTLLVLRGALKEAKNMAFDAISHVLDNIAGLFTGGLPGLLTTIKTKFIDPLVNGFNKDFFKDFKLSDVPKAFIELFTGVEVSAEETDSKIDKLKETTGDLAKLIVKTKAKSFVGKVLGDLTTFTIDKAKKRTLELGKEFGKVLLGVGAGILLDPLKDAEGTMDKLAKDAGIEENAVESIDAINSKTSNFLVTLLKARGGASAFLGSMLEGFLDSSEAVSNLTGIIDKLKNGVVHWFTESLPKTAEVFDFSNIWSSIKDGVVHFVTVTIPELISSIGEGLGNLWDSIINFDESSTGSGIPVSDFLVDLISEHLPDGVVNALTSIKENFIDPLGSGIADLFSDFKISDIPGAILSLFTGVEVSAAELTDTVSEDSVKTFSFFETLSNGISMVTASLKPGIDFIGEQIDWIKDKIDKFLHWLNPEFDYSYESIKKTITDVGSFITGTRMLFGLGTFTGNVNKFLTNAKSWPKSINKIIKAIGDIPESLSYMIGGAEKKGIFQKIGAFFVGDKTRREGGLKGLFGQIGYFFTELGDSVENVSKGIKRSDTASALLKVAVAVGVLAASFYFLSKISWDEFKVGAAAIGVITGALAILLLVLSRFTNKGDASVSNSSGLKNLTGLTGGLKKFIQDQLKPLKKEFEQIKKSAFFATIALVIGKLVSVFVKLGKLNSAQILGGIIALGAIMAEFVVMLHFINKEFKDSNVTLRQSIALIAAALAIKMVATAFRKLGDMSLGGIIKGIIGMIAVVGAMSVVLDATKGDGGWGKLLALIPIIAEVTGAMLLLSLIPAKRLKSVSTSLVKAFASIALVIFSVSSMKNVSGGKMFGTLITIGLLIAEITGVFMLLDSIGVTNVDKIGDGFMKLMLGMAALAAGLGLMMGKGFTGAHVFQRGLGAAGVVGIVIGILGVVAGIAGAIDKYLLHGTITASLERGAKIATNLGSIIGGLLGGIVSGVVKPIKEALFGDVNLDFSSTLTNFSDFMEKVATTFSKEYKINNKGLSSMGGLITDIGKAELFNSVGEFIDGLILITPYFGRQGENTDLYDKLDKYAEFVEHISAAFGDDSKFNLKAIGTVAKVISAMGEAEINNANANFVQNFNDFIFGYGDHKETYGEKLAQFATDMVTYSEIIDGMDDAAVSRTKSAVKIIQKFGEQLPNSGGIIQEWTGEGNFKDFVSGLPTFGAKIKKYSEKIEGMKTDAVTNTAIAVNTIIQFGRDITFSHGMLQTLIGEKNFGNFVDGLTDFGEAMVTYSESIEGMKTDAVANTTAAVDSIIKLGQDIPNSGGVLGLIMGNNDIDDFGQMLVNFAVDMKWFDTYLDGLEYKGVQPAITAISDLGGAFDTFSGIVDNSADYTNGIHGLAAHVDTLYQELSGTLERDKGTTLKKMGGSIVAFILEGFETEIGQENVISKFLGLLSDLVASTAATKTMDSKARLLITTVFNAIDELLKEDDSRFNKGFKLILDHMFDDGDSTIQTRGVQMRAKMNSAFLKLIAAINSHRTGVTLAVKSVFNEIQNVVDAAANTIKLSGTNIMRGLAQGITTGQKLATDAAKTSAQAVITTTNNTLKEKSPSREAMKSGRFYMEGLRLGILDNETFLLSTVDKVASSAVSRMDDNIEGMRGVSEDTMNQVYASIITAWNYIQAAVDESMSYSPVITPILDLSNVNAGLGQVNGMFSDTSMFSRLSVPGFSIGNNHDVKTGDNYNQEAIVSQIRGLRTDINILGDAMSRMQITMNTGQVVGAVTPGIDRSLGSIQKYNARWA